MCRARVFDSKWKNKLTTDSEIQIAHIYGAGEKKFLRVEICPVQQQNGTLDCGVFAVSFATDLCHGLDPTAVTYSQKDMRQHLLHCLESHKFSPFPRAGYSVKISTRAIKTIQVYCSCKLPESFDVKMVECELCMQWFHYKCVGITDTCRTDNWLCQKGTSTRREKLPIEN